MSRYTEKQMQDAQNALKHKRNFFTDKGAKFVGLRVRGPYPKVAQALLNKYLNDELPEYLSDLIEEIQDVFESPFMLPEELLIIGLGRIPIRSRNDKYETVLDDGTVVQRGKYYEAGHSLFKMPQKPDTSSMDAEKAERLLVKYYGKKRKCEICQKIKEKIEGDI